MRPRESRRRQTLALVSVALASVVVTSTPASAGRSDDGQSPASVVEAGTFIPNANRLVRDELLVHGAPGVPLLSSWHFGYRNGDHHIWGIHASAREGGFGGFGLADKNFDDTYQADVSWQWISPANDFVQGRAEVQSCRNECILNTIPRPTPDHVFVLSGFRINWSNPTDHHLDRLEVRQAANGNLIAVAFSDDSDDDLFHAIVDYAWVPNSLFLPGQHELEIIKTVEAIGDSREPVAFGPKVISGFQFVASDDNHVLNIGVRARQNVIETHLRDNDAFDSGPWTYRVVYGILR